MVMKLNKLYLVLPYSVTVPYVSSISKLYFSESSCLPLSDELSAHSCDFHKDADDTELSQSAPHNEFGSVQTGIQTCTEDILSWMNSNKLMLKTDKTEAMTKERQWLLAFHLTLAG